MESPFPNLQIRSNSGHQFAFSKSTVPLEAQYPPTRENLPLEVMEHHIYCCCGLCYFFQAEAYMHNPLTSGTELGMAGSCSTQRLWLFFLFLRRLLRLGFWFGLLRLLLNSCFVFILLFPLFLVSLCKEETRSEALCVLEVISPNPFRRGRKDNLYFTSAPNHGFTLA